MKKLYNYLDKRLSIRKVNPNNLLTKDDLNKIISYLNYLQPLFKDLDVSFELVDKDKTNSKIGEYQLLIYSNKYDDNDLNYLLNIGYMVEQLDLYLFSLNIGCCWLGLPKPKKEFKNKQYVIMLGITKISEIDLRNDISLFKRKNIDEIWEGSFNEDVMNKSILAPSACNSQSWKVKVENNILYVYRDRNVKTIIPKGFRNFFNTIDLGIFMCFLEITMIYNDIKFERIINNTIDPKNNFVLVAQYNIINE